MLKNYKIEKDFIGKVVADLKNKKKFDLESASVDNETKNKMRELIDKIEEISFEELESFLNNVDVGIYETCFSGRIVQDMFNVKLAHYYIFEYKEPYGLCDNYEQILKAYPELQDPNRTFIITYSWMFRKDEPSEGGFRYHKNGGYIGDLNARHEYFYDDKHIDKLMNFNIYEVMDENVKIDDYTDSWVALAIIANKLK